MKVQPANKKDLVSLCTLLDIQYDEQSLIGTVVGRKKKVFSFSNRGRNNRVVLFHSNGINKDEYNEIVEEFLESHNADYVLEELFKLMERDMVIYYIEKIRNK